MRRCAAPWRRSRLALAAVLHVAFASLATALVTVLGVTSANGLGSPDTTASDSLGVRAPAMSGALATAGVSASPGGPGVHLRGAVPAGGVLTTSAGPDDSDDRGLAPPGADVSHRVRPVGPVVPGSGPVARAPGHPSGVTSTVQGRAPPA